MIREVLIVKRELAYEVYEYFLDEEVTEDDRKYYPDNLVKLNEKEIKEIKEGLEEYEELQDRMQILRRTRKVVHK